MSEEQEPKPGEPARLPDDAKIETRGYAMNVVFHPEIRLDTKRGPDFAKVLSEIFVPTSIEFKSDSWQFMLPQGAMPDGFVSVVVQTNALQFIVSNPEYTRDWYETRFGLLLTRFQAFFKPLMILQSSTMMHGLLPIEGDARTFLAIQVGQMDPDRMKPFGRPIQLLGLRFFMPPFMVKSVEHGKGKSKKTTEQVTEWQVNVRIESLLEDPKKLFLQAEADWVKPAKWDDAAEKRILSQLDTVSDYMSKNIVGFLRHHPEADQD
jgi:hypothetical protein